jgi:hypothetical protein
MALGCAQCGTDNPVGNAFCMSCGSSLAAAPASASTDVTEDITLAMQTGTFVGPGTPPALPVAVAPGTALPPLSFLPPGYAPPPGPYLPAPPSGTALSHRTSSTMLIAIVVIALLVVCGGGVAFAALHTGGATPAPNANIPVNVPITVPTTAPTAAPTEPPASTPQPASNNAGGHTVSTSFAKVFVPGGYTVVDQQSDSIVISPSNSEDAAGAQAQALSGATTNAQLDQELLAGDQQSDDPSAKMCSTKAPSQTQILGSGGPITADVITICENLTPPNGPAFAAVDGYFAGVAKAADGSFKAVWFEFLAPASSFQAFTNSIPPAFISQTVFSDAGSPA